MTTTALAPGLPAEFLVPGLPFSGPELRAMELSGLLRHVIGDLYLPAHHEPRHDLHIRVASVARLAAPVLTGRWTVIGLTAAWIHAGGAPPAVLEASVERFHRIPAHPLPVHLKLEQSDAATDAGDAVDFFGVRCSTVERTVEDLLRRAGATASPDALAAAARLVPRCDAGVLRRRFERRRKRPGMIAARRSLELLLGR